MLRQVTNFQRKLDEMNAKDPDVSVIFCEYTILVSYHEFETASLTFDSLCLFETGASTLPGTRGRCV